MQPAHMLLRIAARDMRLRVESAHLQLRIAPRHVLLRIAPGHRMRLRIAPAYRLRRLRIARGLSLRPDLWLRVQRGPAWAGAASRSALGLEGATQAATRRSGEAGASD